MDKDALQDETRAYGGVLRSVKGDLVETMAQCIVQLAWLETGGAFSRLSFNDVPQYSISIRHDYVEMLNTEVRQYIKQNLSKYTYNAQVDLHVFIDNEFIMGIECKSYAENAMLKRILIDYRLLKGLYPNLICTLLQLESQLGGDYSKVSTPQTFGSTSSHTLMSYFSEVNLEIITLLEGNREVKKPIHKPEFYKELTPGNLGRAINRFSDLLSPFV